jgi:heme/copper-type cytochrome/quinol oxidase subunit 3
MSSIHNQKHGYHLVDPSPWPFVGSISCFMTTVGAAMYMHSFIGGNLLLLSGIIMILITMILWWRDIIREATFQGHHTYVVQKGLRYGMILFIISEVFFFIAFFWAFFHSSLAPSVELGAIWPPHGIQVLNAWEVPLLNTVILLSSGATVTWAHHAIISGDRQGAITGLALTILLALIFTALQGLEYYEAPFTIADGVYGTTFYIATGFHGLHVIIGTIFLTVCLLRLIKYHFTKHHHFGFEAAAWYFHFVDVVWLFLFVTIYWWGA